MIVIPAVLFAAGLQISSPAFPQNGMIPTANTCDGTAGNPALLFSGIPPGAKTLAVVVEDPDVPWILKSNHLYVHWVTWDLAPESHGILEGKATGGIHEDGTPGYVQPCPPIGEHRYVFKLFALDTRLADTKISSAADLYRAMDGHTLDHAELVGRYSRPVRVLIVPVIILLGILSVALALFTAFVYGAYRGLRFLTGRSRP